MLASAARSASRSSYLAPAIGAVVHAALVVLLWAGALYFDISVLPGRAWLALSWLWPIWPIVLMLHRHRTPTRVLVPTLIGVALLAPCLPTIWSFTMWSL